MSICVLARDNRALIKATLHLVVFLMDALDMTNLDPERFTLRQAAQGPRMTFAQVMDELEFVKAQLAQLPTRRDQAFVP